MGSPNSGPPQLPPEFFEPHGPPVSRSGQLLATNISCLIVATLFVSMRVYSQAFLLRSLWWDDCKVLPSPRSYPEADAWQMFAFFRW